MRIRSASIFLLFLSCIFFLVSCQKEVSFDSRGGQGGGTSGGGGGGGTTGNSIIGDYDFVGLSAHTVSAVTVTQAGQELKSITTSDYTSKNNIGTVKITVNQMISTGLAYDIDTVVNTKTYANGVLLDDSNLPFAQSVPPTSGTSTYVQNNPDSITVTGAFGISSDPSGSGSTGSSGYRISWAGDTLILKVSASVTQSISQGGVPAVLTGTVNGIVRLKKHP